MVYIFQANKDIDMKTIAELRRAINTLHYDMFGFYPTFGSAMDWNDRNWLNRMYSSLYEQFNSMPEELMVGYAANDE